MDAPHKTVFCLSKDNLEQWREAANLQNYSTSQTTSRTGYIHSAVFFMQTYNQFTTPTEGLRETLLEDNVKIDDLYEHIAEKSVIEWDIMKQMHDFYIRTQSSNPQDQALQDLNTKMTKIGTLLDLRKKAIELYNHVQNILQTRAEISRYEQQMIDIQEWWKESKLSETKILQWLNRQGATEKKYTLQFSSDGATPSMVPVYTDAKLLSSRLAKLLVNF